MTWSIAGLAARLNVARSWRPAQKRFMRLASRGPTRDPVAGCWLVRKSCDGGATWATVDSVWDYSAKEARAVGFSSKGSVFVAGAMNVSFGAEGGGVWAVRRSTNNGASWATVDNYQIAHRVGCGSMRELRADKTGPIYVTGMAKGRTDGGNQLVNQWVVRRSLDNGTSWLVVD